MTHRFRVFFNFLKMKGQVVSNQPYDEALDVSDQEEVPSTFSSPQVPPTRPQQQGTTPTHVACSPTYAHVYFKIEIIV